MSESRSSTDLRKSLIVLPNALPKPARRDGPKITKAMIRIMSQSLLKFMVSLFSAVHYTPIDLPAMAVHGINNVVAILSILYGWNI